MSNSNTSTYAYFKKSLQFLSEYFLYSNRKRDAWLLFSGSILSVSTVIACGFFLGWWCFPYIYGAFLAKNLTLLLIGVGSGLLFAAAMAGFNYLALFLKNKLYVDWRSWLTKKVLHQYLRSKTNYLEISRLYPEIDNPEQRIQEDIDKVVESSLDLSIGFIDNFSNFAIYTTLLCLTGSALPLIFVGANVLIPGYLVLVALLIGTATSLIGYFINKSLGASTNEEIKTQSSLRADLQQLKTCAEEIAIEHAENYYQSRLEREIDELTIKTSNRLLIQNGTVTYNVFNGIFQAIVPFIAAAPLYFNDLITLDLFYSVGYYFSMMTRSLNWFINSFETINKFKTSLERIITLQKILDGHPEHASTQKIIRTIDREDKHLVVKNLDITLHHNNELIIKGMNLKFSPGVHTLIQAPSGTGKSSLFKAIAGTWLAGEGEIIIPKSLESIYFLPQKPTLPDDILRKVLFYPDAEGSYSNEEMVAALKAVNLGHLVNNLDERVGFKSLGEQQRIAFARVLLRKPDWVFLDEATASLDEGLEELIYRGIKKLLPNTTIISIAHRSTVKHHHNNILFFNVDAQKEVKVEEISYDLALMKT
ncbi:ATP-binding cassette domain-containing protein [Fluoribacter dumoffii]|uniref:ABC transporter ATP-binding protein/permease n=1 Tax=Fluoribacter dumoffii TaxID=463 RepID=UPI002244CF76|nr:ATP-binding cassette domain-containing protein [Fluoribacter dumoffii]MCW8418679.1 ATP-binding cassette domain-containing protein [Fluoribacter dumoffii]MCW8453477.1 ATP-binding cassette domain-containing protein [Fluoribacter dumoffii]MCW8459303.1 ATP-binding cassette domain-containing protein [Fluoribacter dumoffii]MCW8482662.1 ATP-binding cassette domain-containing protein [Fluoribacter dumoffii]